MQWVLCGITLALVHAQPCLDGVCTEEDDQTQDVEETMLIQKAHKLNAPDMIPGEANAAYGGINGGVTGGVDHENIENDFDWDRLATFKKPNCKGVCRSPTNSYCYPVKGNHYLGPPCGVLTTGPTNNYGCFLNEPTQTCALCTMAQGYCCPYAEIRECQEPRVVPGGIIPGEVNAVYGGVNGGVTGGMNHGDIENDYDWGTISTFTEPKCGGVCRSPTNSYCYPVKPNNYLGPPCGVLTTGPSNNYGCFLNEPTQTCALCTMVQGYCCPYAKIPLCTERKLPAPPSLQRAIIPGGVNAVYGGVNGGVTGGLNHDDIENDFDWDRLATFKNHNCWGVCRSPTNSYCYPIKPNLHLGPPCGVLTTGPTNNYGCFLNEPTQTCALCTMAQGYCCPYAQIPECLEPPAVAN